MKRIIILYIVLILLVGCGKPESKEAYPGEVLDEPIIEDNVEVSLSAEEQDKIIKEFYSLLMDNTEEDALIKFVDENISKLDMKNADTIVLEMEDYLLIKLPDLIQTYQLVYKYTDYTSDEVKSYLELLKLESQDVYTDGENLNIGLEELLKRALTAERHLKDYSIGKTNKRVYDLYEAYIYGAVLGSGNQYIYAKEGSSIINDEVLKAYNEIIDKDNSSYTSKILAQYIDELNKDNGDLNGGNVIYFYDNLDRIIKMALN